MLNLFGKRGAILASLGLALTMSVSSLALATDLTINWTNDPQGLEQIEAVISAFEAKNPDITIEVETRIAGADGDNFLKTAIATGEVSDMFMFNPGALLQAMRPDKTMIPITDEEVTGRINDAFKTTVSSKGNVYGVPWGTAMVGGVLYNKRIYNELGLDVPKTWKAFMENSQVIKDSGVAPVVQSFGSDWSAQLFLLAHFYNVFAADPDFVDNYTNNKAKYATHAVARRGFEYQQEVYDAGFLNDDFASATYEDAVRKIATGEGVQYPALSAAIGTIVDNHPDTAEDVGFFALPGDNPEQNGLTVWMPNAVYISVTTEHEAEAKRFLDFVGTVEVCEILSGLGTPSGPYLISGCSLPDKVPGAVADLQPYFDANASTAPALEFVSPIKGPLLPQITVEVGSGFRTALSGAKLYDIDVKRQAQQLGLPGWE